MPTWKENWAESRVKFEHWWDRQGVLVGHWSPPGQAGPAREGVASSLAKAFDPRLYTDPLLRAEWNHAHLSRGDFSDESLPIADTDLGPGSLCLFFGCQPHFSPETVWFDPCWHQFDGLASAPPPRLDPDNPWWKLTRNTLQAAKRKSEGRYFVGCPDLIENIDILAALRDPQLLMVDLLDDPGTVREKVRQITDCWMEAYQEIYDIIREPDGSATFGAFRLWAPGKVAKLQCDASAMFSPAFFRDFVQPDLIRQCEWLDYSLYHLDGTQAVCHLDALLEIEALDAIEWTPQAGLEGGAHPRWHPMYRRILEAGKSLQVICSDRSEIDPLLDQIGRDGVYIILP